MDNTLASFTDLLDDEICHSQPISLSSSMENETKWLEENNFNIGDTRTVTTVTRPSKCTGQRGQFRSIEEIDPKFRDVFTYPYFNLVQSKVIDDALYSDKSIVVCAPTGSGKTVVFEMAIVQLLMELEDKHYTEDFKIIYMAPVKALCTERLTEWYPKFTKLGLLCIEVTGDTDVDFTQLAPYKIIITTPEKWDMLTRRWRDHRSLVEVIKLFLIDEVHILNDETRGPVLEAVVSRMKTIESSAQSVHRIELLQNQLHGSAMTHKTAPSIRFVAVSATVSNPEDVANWLGTSNKPAVYHKFGDECRPVKLNKIVEGYPCPEGMSIFKFDIILNYKLWPIITKYHSGKPTLIFCNTRKSVTLTAETLSRELTINFNAEQKAKLMALGSTIKNKKLQSLVMNGVGCHHAGLLYEERQNIERAFRNRDLPILITTTTLAMGVNLPAHLVIIKNTQQYVNGAFQEYSISTVLQMVGRAGRPQFDTEATAVIMTRHVDKGRYQALVGGCEPLQSFLHKRLPENLNSEAALGTVGDVAQCVQWLRSTFLYVRAARDPKKYLGLPQNSPQHLISKKVEELCVKAMNGLASSGLITMDEASCIESTEAGRLMSVFYLDVETMKLLMKIEGSETLERLLILVCESHELSDMHLRMDERRCLNALNRNNTAATIRFPMKGKISTRQMKLNCIIQAVLGCLSIPDPSLNQEAMKIMRIADRVCKCLVAYVTRPDLISRQPKFYTAVLNSIILAKCIAAHLWENSPFVSKQLKGIGPTFSTLLATAGKVNFILLEESHPRDLERIMNKSAPAGNVLRRQISLLPKYQLSMTPIDESTVMVQLDLLNQNFLSQNMDQLTAGGNHKCFIIVGDSANHLLLLASFKDTDLIRVFDGTIKHEIRRRHNFEHKMFAYCISTTFVGVDVQSEYMFNNLGQFLGSSYTNSHQSETLTDETMKKQTCSDTLKKRKRKGSAHLDKTQSKEKKKRENAIIQNFKYLKKTFEAASNNVKENMSLPIKKHLLPINDIVSIPEKEIAGGDEVTDDVNYDNEAIDIESDDFIDNDEKINNILTDIENEMLNRKIYSTNTHTRNSKQNDSQGASLYKHQGIRKIPNHSKIFDNKSLSATKRQKSLPVKSNYAFIDLLEKEINLTDDDDQTVASNTNNGFSDTIKSHINKYIQKTESKSHMHDSNVSLLLENKDNSKSDRKQYSNEIADADGEEVTSHKQYPHYEIKEILDKQNLTIETERSKKIECGPEKSVINSPSNTDSQSLTNLLNKDDLILILKPSHNMKEGIQPYTDKTDSNNLCIEEENYQKSNIHFNTFKQNSDEAHVYSSVLQIGTNDEITSLENELTTLRNNDTLKSSHGMKEGNQGYTKNNLNILCTEKENFLKPKSNFCTFKQNSEKAYIDSSDFQIGTNDYTTSLDNELPTLQKNEDLILTHKQSHGMKEVNQRYTNKIDSSNHFLNFEHNLEKAHVDSSDFKIKYNNKNKDKCSISNDRKLIEENCIHMIENSPEKHYVPATESHNFHLSPGFDVDIKDLNKMDLKKIIRMDTYNKEFNEGSYKNYDFKQRDALIINATSNSTSNLMCCAKRSHFTNTPMLINNKEPTIPSKLFRTNSYSQSRLIYSNCLPHHSVNKKTSIQNYSMTATEVDLQSCINVVKEIKIDMNISVSVTQILQNNIPESDNLQKPENVVHTHTRCDHFQNYLQDINNAVKSTEITIKKDLEKQDIHNKTILHQRNSNSTAIENKQLNEENNTKNDAVNYYNTNSINDVNEINGSSLVDLEESTTLHEKTKEQKESDNKRKTSEVQNILQKYSIIFGNDTIKSSTGAVINKNTISNKLPTPQCKKPLEDIQQKRPFKISNITKLQTTLPEQLTNCYKQNVQQFTPISMKIVDNESISKKYTEPESCLPLSNVDSEDEYVPHPTLNDLDMVTDIAYCNIDQSMFDPKTLLQCSANADSEEIIAPPSQFCDNDYNLHSPNYYDVEEPNTSDNYKPYPELQFIYSKDKDFNNQESIFEDHCPANLTPSREIETWTLAEKDCWEKGYDSSLSPSPAKSFTVIRRCDSKRSELLGNKAMTNMSRQIKLRQFKFTDKKKLSKRK